jgi:hypothetical protein
VRQARGRRSCRRSGSTKPAPTRRLADFRAPTTRAWIERCLRPGVQSRQGDARTEPGGNQSRRFDSSRGTAYGPRKSLWRNACCRSAWRSSFELVSCWKPDRADHRAPPVVPWRGMEARRNACLVFSHRPRRCRCGDPPRTAAAWAARVGQAADDGHINWHPGRLPQAINCSCVSSDPVRAAGPFGICCRGCAWSPPNGDLSRCICPCAFPGCN